MHPSPAYGWNRASALAFIADYAFAHVFAVTPEGPRVVHVPVLVVGECLRFHLANSNALTPHIAEVRVLASVGGPGHYVSPNWYVDGRQRVPTWNYVAVECEGLVRRMSDDELVALLDASSAEFEPRVGQDWSRAKMDPARFTTMTRAITGFELRIEALRATRKLSQDKPEADVRGVVAGLRASGQDSAAAELEHARGW